MQKFTHIDKDYLYNLLSTKADWYLEINEFLNEHFFEFSKNKENKTKEWFEKSEKFIQLVSLMIEENSLCVSKFKYGLDKTRKPIDTVVIHHTSREPDVEIECLEQALTLIRIYAKAFSDPKNRFYGKPIGSDHFYKEKMTFMPYHYVILQDGTIKNYLQDENLGWHCGNSDYNSRSIAICFHDDLMGKHPTDKAIAAAKSIIERYKPQIILGHKEISDTTTCPGNTYEKWRSDLIKNLKEG